jgi:Predicted AAA-ATPase
MKNLPLGIQHFDELIERKAIYVDKTAQIYSLLSDFKAAFLSRPRRFGKSLLLSTIAQLYSGKRALFQGLWIEDQWDWTKVHPVVHFYMDRTGFKDWGLSTGLNKHLDLIAAEHQLELSEESPAFRLSELIGKLYQKYQKRVVVLFDEYDKPMLDVLHLPEEAEKNRQILGDFYGILKPIGDKIEFLMLTGISKFSQVSVFSNLNLKTLLFTVVFQPLQDTPKMNWNTTLSIICERRSKTWSYHPKHCWIKSSTGTMATLGI